MRTPSTSDTEAGLHAHLLPEWQRQTGPTTQSVKTTSKESDITGEALSAGLAQGLVIASEIAKAAGGGATKFAISAVCVGLFEAYVTWGFREQQKQFRYDEKAVTPWAVGIAQQINVIQETAVAMMISGTAVASPLGIFLITATAVRMAKRWGIDSNWHLPNWMMQVLAPIFPTGEATIMHLAIPLKGFDNLAQYVYGLYHNSPMTMGLRSAIIAAPLIIGIFGAIAERCLQRWYDTEKGIAKQENQTACAQADHHITCMDKGSYLIHTNPWLMYASKLASQSLLFAVAVASISQNLFKVTLAEVFKYTVGANWQTGVIAVSALVGAGTGLSAGDGQFKSRLPYIQGKMATMFKPTGGDIEESLGDDARNPKAVDISMPLTPS